MNVNLIYPLPLLLFFRSFSLFGRILLLPLFSFGGSLVELMPMVAMIILEDVFVSLFD